LAEPIELWPLSLEAPVYHASTTALTALGLESGSGPRKTEAGLVFALERTDGKVLKDLPITDLPVHFVGPQLEATALYEQFFSSLTRVQLRWLDSNDEPVFRTLPQDSVQQVGFDDDYPLYGKYDRFYPGCTTILEWFSFSRKFLGFKLANLNRALRGIDAKSVQVIFEFDKPNMHLNDYFGSHSLALFCAPAVNLFEDYAKPVEVDKKHHRRPVSPNRTPVNNFEVLRVEGVKLEYKGVKDIVEVLPLYALPSAGQDPKATHYYSIERSRRSLTQEERKLGGTSHRYEGTESWITLYNPPESEDVLQLFVRTLCSNRHLPEVLPISDAKFVLLDDKTISFDCLAGPSEPRESVAELEREGPHRYNAGDNYWRLISFLTLSQRGFSGPDQSGNIAALQEMLRLFSDISSQLTSAQIVGVHEMTSRPCTRTVKRKEGFLTTRGLEISLTFDEGVFDSGTIIALSAMLDRFFADYAAINTFTQLVVKNRRGKTLHTWPPRGGSGPLL
jgi:type VI secretion system protein ImpG